MTEPSSPGWLCRGLTATDNGEAVALLEFEICPVERAVVQLHHKLTACAGPNLFGLPDVNVRVCAGVVGETARSSGDCLFDAIHPGRRVAGNYFCG